MATTEGGHVSRDARRRRITERGSDRLALITGRIQSLPSDSAQSPPDTPPVEDSTQHETVTSNQTLPGANQNSIQQDVLTKEIEPSLPNREKAKGIASRAMALFDIDKDLSQIISSSSSTSAQNLMPDTQSPQHNRRDNTLTTSQISSVVSSSENIRLICSVLVGLLVILSYANFPILGCNIIRSALLLRPVYLLFLTNISIVVGRLILETRGLGLKAWFLSSVPTFGGNDLVGQLGKALELGLLLQKIFGGLFIDFCIYAVVLICGLSVIRVFGG